MILRRGCLEPKDLHTLTKECVLASGSVPGRQGEGCILNGSRPMAVHNHVLCRLQHSGDIREINGDSFNTNHPRLICHVPGQRDRDRSHFLRAPALPVESGPAVQR
jgi:hypothetical protein